jgi:uncharacterized protein with FMN-binding domain
MRRIVLWFLSTLTVVVLLFGYHTSTSGTLTAGSDVVVPAPATPGAATTPSAGATGGTSSTGSSGSTKKKTVTGPLVQTRWGPVQVKVTASGGKLTDVTVVQYPYNNPKDQEINDYAIPVLVQEAIDAQSADIDMVSGATVTSVGYQSSLQSALDEVGL